MQRWFLAATILLAVAARLHAQTPESLLDKLLAQVKQEKNNEARAAAIAHIARLKPEVAVPALVGLLATPREDVRLHVALALGEIGKPAVGPLQKALCDSDETVRFYAVWALGLAGSAAKPATPALIAAMRDEDEEVRYKAAYALGEVMPDSDEAIAALIGALKDTDADVVAEAKAALAKFGIRAVAPLRKALTQRSIAFHATDALSKLARVADDATANAAVLAVPDVLALLRSAKTEDEQTLAGLLPAFGPKALPALRAAIKDTSPRMRCGLAHAISEIGSLTSDAAGTRHAIEMLIGLMSDADLDVRLTACTSLALLASPEAGLGRRAIETALTDDWFEFSYAAYEALRDPYDDSQPLDDLFDKRIAAAKGDDRIRLACLLPHRHSALLVKNLRHRDPALRLRCACGLTLDAKALPEPDTTIKLLLPILTDGITSAHASRRRDAAEALARLAVHPDANVIPPLLAALKSTDAAVREAAIDGLGVAADRDPRAIAALAPLLRTRDSELRRSVMLALERCGAAAVPHYIALLKHPDVQARLRACDWLLDLAENRALADKAKDAVPPLAALARTAECRQTAIATIRAIAPEIAFAPLLEALEGDPQLGATLRRAAKAGREPGKMLAVLLRDLRDADPRVGRDAAEALAQLETITWQQRERFYLTATVRSLEATAALAAQRLSAGEGGAGRDAIGQLVALRSLVQVMQSRLGMMTPLEPGVTLEMRQGELAKLSQAIADSLNRASNNPDPQVRRLARRATRVTPLFNPWLTCPPDVRTGLPRLPVRLHPKTTKRAEAA